MHMKNAIIFTRNLVSFSTRRWCSTLTNTEVRKIRNELFNKEKQRQLSLTTRLEKIEVKYKGLPEECTLVMNKNISTPYNCALHMNEVLHQESVIAEVDGKLWDFHRPLTDSCELRFLHFKNAPALVNKLFWRSCSFMLGSVIEKAFKDKYFIELHSWPKPNIESGSYVYDVDIKIENWNPSESELRCFSVLLWKLGAQKHQFDRLDISETLALQMFEHNRFKKQQIPDIAAQSEDRKVTVYRVDDHIDISYGPMISNTKFLGTTQVTAVYPLNNGTGYRFQAVSLPRQLTLNSFGFSLLVERAKKLNTWGLKSEEDNASNEDNVEEELANKQA